MEGGMTREPKSDPSHPEKISRAKTREIRLKAALKANMAKRKAQTKARSGDITAGLTGPDNEKE
jgi:hypothetical protein